MSLPPTSCGDCTCDLPEPARRDERDDFRDGERENGRAVSQVGRAICSRRRRNVGDVYEGSLECRFGGVDQRPSDEEWAGVDQPDEHVAHDVGVYGFWVWLGELYLSWECVDRGSSVDWRGNQLDGV